MSRAIVVAFIFGCLISSAILVESPAIPGPFLDNCTLSMIGLYAARYNLEVCKSRYGSLNPIYHCKNEIIAVGEAEDAVDMNCTFEQM